MNKKMIVINGIYPNHCGNSCDYYNYIDMICEKYQESLKWIEGEPCTRCKSCIEYN
jgi:hypothetical protein